jgi:hypothetical protein
MMNALYKMLEPSQIPHKPLKMRPSTNPCIISASDTTKESKKTGDREGKETDEIERKVKGRVRKEKKTT